MCVCVWEGASNMAWHQPCVCGKATKPLQPWVNSRCVGKAGPVCFSELQCCRQAEADVQARGKMCVWCVGMLRVALKAVMEANKNSSSMAKAGWGKAAKVRRRVWCKGACGKSKGCAQCQRRI